ncbi:MAG TPA: hypothetical protein VE134_00200 [Methanomicrobiales archaeon]|nr:hypothetical protein [Methanomicrobiales archaeon]
MSRWSIILLAALCTFGILAGCVESSFGDVSYDGKVFHIAATNGESPVDAVLQVTAFRVGDLNQEKAFENVSVVRFEQGSNTYTVPADLQPGDYKLYVYLTIGNERKASVIRDIVV